VGKNEETAGGKMPRGFYNLNWEKKGFSKYRHTMPKKTKRGFEKQYGRSFTEVKNGEGKQKCGNKKNQGGKGLPFWRL